jgi:RNA polymerase sigma-70 factor, ECF subfamily
VLWPQLLYLKARTMIGPEARGAWKELERHLRPYLARRVASPADIDDLLQDILLRLHQGLGSLRDEERFGGWVYRIAHSAIVDQSRRRTRAPRLESTDEPQPAHSSDDAAVQLQSDLGECVALFVGRLPSPYREAITLTELEGLSQAEAAEMLGISLSGMKSRVQRGRDKIRHMFDECCQISIDARGRVIECEPRPLAQVPADCRDAATAWAARVR